MKAGSRDGLLLGACALAGLAAYAAAFDNGFRADDFAFLGAVRGAASPAALLAPQPGIAFYRPLALLLFALEERLFGLHGGLYLAFNTLLQAGAAGLGLLLLKELGLSSRAAALAAGAFFLGLFHYGKQVTWACASGSLLALLCLLAALRLAGAAPASGRGPRLLRRLALLTLALAAPFAHESGLLLGPLVMLRGLIAGPAPRARAWRLGALLGAAALGSWLLATGSAGTHTAGRSLAEGGLAFALPRWLRYFGLAVVPVQVSSLAAWPALRAAASGAQLLLGAALVALCVRQLAARRGSPGRRFLAAWALLAPLPYAAVPLPPGWLELRYLHGAALPLAGLAAAALGDLAPGWRRRAGGALALAAILAALAAGLTLERKYDREARSPENRARLAALAAPPAGGR